MSDPKMLTAIEAYKLIRQRGSLPCGIYDFCDDVLTLWGVKPANVKSWGNLVFMLSSVFMAGVVYAERVGGAADDAWNV